MCACLAINLYVCINYTVMDEITLVSVLHAVC